MPAMTYQTWLRQQGQMTLPKDLVELHHLHDGQELTIFDLDGRFLVVPKKSRVDVISNQLRDELLDAGATLPEMLTELRSRRER